MKNTKINASSKKTILFGGVVGMIVLSAWVWWVKQVQAPQEAQTSLTPDAETASINQELDSISSVDLNAEFDAIDKDLQGL